MRAAALLPSAVALVVFAGTLQGGFVLDDTRLVEKNPLVHSPPSLTALVTSDYWAPHHVSGLFRPLVTLSFAANAWLTGASPIGFHAVNIALHALVTGLVFGVFRTVAGREDVATLGALLFAVHAVHTEVVANVAGRAELLCAAFVLAALLAWLSATADARRIELFAYLACLVLAGLAVFSKENAVSIVAVLPLAVFARGATGGSGFRAGLAAVANRPGLLAMAGVALVVAVCFCLRFAVLSDGNHWPEPSRMDNPLIALTAPLRIENALLVMQRAIGLLLVPATLVYDYGRAQLPIFESGLHPAGLLAVSATLLEAAAVLWLLVRAPIAGFGAAFFFVTYAAVSNVVLPIGTIFGERLLYLPSVGFCLVVGVAVCAVAERLAGPTGRQRALLVGITALLVVPHAVRAVVRADQWSDVERLYLADLAAGANSARIQYNAGFIYARRGDYETAIYHYDRAVEIEPRYLQAYFEAGVAFAAGGRYVKAIPIFDTILVQDPGDVRAHTELGAALLATGETERGIDQLETAARLAPDTAWVQRELALGFERVGNQRAAQTSFHYALELDPEDEEARVGLARVRALRESQRNGET